MRADPMVMSSGSAVVARAKSIAAARGVAVTTVSKWLFRDWRRIGAIASGKSFLRPPTERLALRRLSAIEHGKPLPPTPKKKRNH